MYSSASFLYLRKERFSSYNSHMARHNAYRIGIDARLWNETGVGRYIRNLVAQLEKIDSRNTYVLFLRQKEFDSLSFSSKRIEKCLADISWHTVQEQMAFPKIIEEE